MFFGLDRSDRDWETLIGQLRHEQKVWLLLCHGGVFKSLEPGRNAETAQYIVL